MSFTGWGDVLALPINPGRDHIRGTVDAPISLLEYGDYECPFCGVAYPVVEAVREEMGDALRFVYRHFPLTTVHPHAWMAAEASEAAGAQRRFWPMHDLLFEDQEHLAVPDLVTRARALGLDEDRFEEELAAHVHAGRVQEDFVSGVRSGVPGTPTFFVNGVRYEGPTDVDSLLAAVQMPLVRG
ncbi:MAG TPA: DsbA family protein [Acidimicrobiia bacterium]